MRRLLIVTLVGAALVGIGSTSASAETIGGEQLAQRGVQVNLGPKAKPVPDIAAETWILVDATTGTVLAAKDPHLQRPPASTLKTLTAITVLPQVTLDQTYVATTKDTHLEGARVGLIAGKSYTLEQLFYGMFLRSGNDAATAIARAPGSVKKTIARMNEVARDLQALDTTAKTPNGLDRPGQVSSAYDLALIARAGLARPDFARFVGTKMFNFPGQGSSTYAIYNQNRLLMGGFRGAVGVKTGYTSNAGRTFVGAATRKGTTLIFVGMGIHEGSADAARKALRWGFKNHAKVTPIGALVLPLSATQTGEAAVTPEQPSGESDQELATAGLDIPSAGDPMAPWWFWLILILAAFGLFVGWVGSRRRQMQGGNRSGPHTPPRIERPYRPYQPR